MPLVPVGRGAGPESLLPQTTNRNPVEYPIGFPQCAFWLDPTDTNEAELVYGAYFAGGESTNYLSTADHSDFDLSNTTGSNQTKATFELWLNPNFLYTSGTTGLDRTWFGQNRDAANSGGWWIGSGGSVGQYFNVVLWVSLNSSASSLCSIRVPYTKTFSHVVITYDGTNATAADRALCYIDGVLIDKATYVITGTPPVAFQNPSAIPLSIGREGHSSHHDARDLLQCVRIYKNVVADQASITRRFNYGSPVLYADLTSGDKTGCVGAWDLTETSGDSRADSTAGAHTMAVTGSVPSVRTVKSIRDKGPKRIKFQSIAPSTAGVYVNPAFCTRPRYNPTAINSTPALEFHYQHTMYSGGFDYFAEGASTDIFLVAQFPELLGTEQFLLLSADEAGTARYFLIGWVSNSGSEKPILRIKDSDTSVGDNNIIAQVDLAVDTPYLFNWRLKGTGDDASCEFRLNGTQYSVTYGSSGVYNASWRSVPKRCNLTLAGLTRTSGPDAGDLRAYVGDVAVYSPGLTVGQNRGVEAYFADRANITLAG